MESLSSLNPGDGCHAQGKRLLVMHPLCQPTEFADVNIARRFILRMKDRGILSPDVFEFDQLAGGWRKLDMS